MTSQEEQFDSLFLSIAQHHPQGASQVKYILFQNLNLKYRLNTQVILTTCILLYFSF